MSPSDCGAKSPLHTLHIHSTHRVLPYTAHSTFDCGPNNIRLPADDTLSPVIVASKDKIFKLIEAAKAAPSLKVIIQMEREGDKATQDAAAAAGIKLLSFSEIEDNGAFSARELAPAQPKELATLMYTSGTTGNPKGVMLTHFNIISMLAAANKAGLALTSQDVHISYLPLAHIFERAVMAGVFCEGAAVGFYQVGTHFVGKSPYFPILPFPPSSCWWYSITRVVLSFSIIFLFPDFLHIGVGAEAVRRHSGPEAHHLRVSAAPLESLVRQGDADC
jgi:acyl-CoA synthetase (AMP-forming)/AMP-acid ligase II